MELLLEIFVVKRDFEVAIGASLSIPHNHMPSFQSFNWYNQLLDPNQCAMSMDTKVDLTFFRTFLNYVHHSSYLGKSCSQPCSSNTSDYGCLILSSTAIEILSDLESSNEDYKTNNDKEDNCDMDVKLDMDEMMNILANTSSLFFRNIHTNTSENIEFDDSEI